MIILIVIIMIIIIIIIIAVRVIVRVVGLGIPPLEVKIMLESNPLKSRILVQ